MSNVIVKENETLDSALRRFKRNCAKAGIQQEIRKREHYEKPSVRRKKKSAVVLVLQYERIKGLFPFRKQPFFRKSSADMARVHRFRRDCRRQ